MNNILPILGFFIVSYIIYNRLFKIRDPRELYYINDLAFMFLNSILLLSSVTILIITIHNYYKLLTNKINNQSDSAIVQTLKKLYNSAKNPIHLWASSLIALDIAIKNNIPYYDNHKDYLDVIILYISRIFCKYNKLSITLLLGFSIITQSIVTSCFFIDIVIFYKFFYFYKTLCLLIIPLIISYLIYSITVFITVNLTSLEDVLFLQVIKTSEYKKESEINKFTHVTISEWKEISNSSSKEEYLCLNTFSEKFLIKNPHFNDKDKGLYLEYCVDSLNNFYRISSFIDLYNLKKNIIMMPFNILKYSIYSFCCAYMFF